MVPPVIIRPIATDDFPHVTVIYADAVEKTTASWEWTAPDVEEIGRRAHALQQQGYPYLVAEESGSVVGFAYAGPFRLRDSYRWTVENSVYVSPGKGEQGIGQALMNALIEKCTNQGFRQMVAVIASGENQASIRFHEKLGFSEAGRLNAIGWKHDAWHDWIVMVRPLGDGDKTPPL